MLRAPRGGCLCIIRRLARIVNIGCVQTSVPLKRFDGCVAIENQVLKAQRHWKRGEATSRVHVWAVEYL
jgi:hypothetical protein